MMCWRVICLEQRANDLHVVQLRCHCHAIISCFIKIWNGFTFLMPTYPGCFGKEAVKRVSVFMSVTVSAEFDSKTVSVGYRSTAGEVTAKEKVSSFFIHSVHHDDQDDEATTTIPTTTPRQPRCALPPPPSRR